MIRYIINRLLSIVFTFFFISVLVFVLMHAIPGANLTVEVEAFCSWSACNINILSKASANIGLISYFSAGTEKTIFKKFSE